MSVLVYPVCVSTMLNLLFLFNIVRVLLMKLRAGPAIGTRPSRGLLQAFRATLLLVPLLGLHYLVIPFRPPKKHPWEHFYEVLSALTASFQGLCVAVLFCFCNGEVIAQFKRKWDGRALLRKRANSCTATTVSVRWRERRRCDYQPTESAVPMDDCKRLSSEAQLLQQPHQTVQVIAASNRSGNHNNHTRVLIKRGGDDSSHDECDQTQC
nr:PREDICTED: calcitonin receptor-like [Linepithema humile]